MRSFLASLTLVTLAALVLSACSGMPPVVPAPTPPAVGTPETVPTLPPPAAPTAAAVALATTQPTAPSPAPPPDDRAKPSLTITVDPPEIAWDEQATILVRASDPAGIKDIALVVGDQMLGTGEGEELQVEFIPGAIDGLDGGKSYILVARATDLAGNQAEASASIAVGPETSPSPVPKAATPTSEPALPGATPTADGRTVIGGAVDAGHGAGTPEPRGQTTYKVVQIPLSTYPYEKYLTDTTDPDRADYPVRALDRAAYEAANPRPAPKMYQLLVLENKYIRLGILPELGGRIYELIFKPTGANEFYSNTVVKPTEWGPGSPPYPEGANWWPAAGGLEWGFPVEEHGYEFGTVWGFDHAAQDDGGVMITVFTKTGPENPYAVVDIILPPDTAYFVVQPRVVNPLGGPFQFKFWENAMLAPGKANSVSPDLRLVFPAQQVLVHSSGDPALPKPGQTTAWPVINGRDYSRLGNWTSYFGAFAAPPTGNFAGVYDPAANEGVMRVFPSAIAKGVKLFAPRGAAGLEPKLWTDDGSTYVELHGGLTPNFDDWVDLGPGEEATWSEFWYPVAGIGGLTFANDRAALSLMPNKNTTTATAAIAAGSVRLGLFPTRSLTGRLTVTLPGDEPRIFDVKLSPDRPLVQDLPLNAAVPDRGEARVTLVDAGGETVFDWQGAAQLR